MLLSTRNLRLNIPGAKVQPTFIGLFVVVARVGDVAYGLSLPAFMMSLCFYTCTVCGR